MEGGEGGLIKCGQLRTGGRGVGSKADVRKKNKNNIHKKMLPNKKCTIQVNYILNVIYKTLKNFSIVQLIRNR